MMSEEIKKDRYPGNKAFEKSQTALFWGRANEVNELYQILQSENCLVLYGKSGLGKSSLLNAGLIPMLERKGYISFNIRLQPVKSKAKGKETVKQETPVTILKSNLQRFEKKINVESAQNIPFENLSLWEYLKSCRFPMGFTPVLIFDQFEEFFSNNIQLQTEFLLQLKEILHSEPPVRVLEWYRKINIAERTPAQVEWCSQPPVKIIVALREDRIGDMDFVTSIIPALARVHFKLKPLSVDAARQAIENPAKAENGSFSTEPFAYDETAIKTILDKLRGGRQYVETTQLQIICNQIESKVKLHQVHGEMLTVTETFFGGKTALDDIIFNFYENSIKEFTTPVSRMVARSLAEDRLVDKGKRTLLSHDQVEDFLIQSLQNELQLTKVGERQKKRIKNFANGIIAKLLRLRVIRGDYREEERVYELSHDTLLQPINKAIQERKFREEKERLKREAEKRKEWLAAEKRKVEKERNEKAEADRLRRLAEIAKRDAEKMRKRAEKQQLIAEEQREAAEKAKDAALSDKLLAQKYRRRVERLSVLITVILITALVVFIYQTNRLKSVNRQFRPKVYSFEAQQRFNNGERVLAYAFWNEALKYDPADTVAKKNIDSNYFPLITGTSFIRSIVVSDDGKYVANMLDNGHLVIWQVEEDKFVKDVVSFDSYRDLYFLPNGRALIVDDSSFVHVYDLKQNKELPFSAYRANSVRYIAADKLVVVDSSFNDNKFYDAETLKSIPHLDSLWQYYLKMVRTPAFRGYIEENESIQFQPAGTDHVVIIADSIYHYINTKNERDQKKGEMPTVKDIIKIDYKSHQVAFEKANKISVLDMATGKVKNTKIPRQVMSYWVNNGANWICQNNEHDFFIYNIRDSSTFTLTQGVTWYKPAEDTKLVLYDTNSLAVYDLQFKDTVFFADKLDTLPYPRPDGVQYKKDGKVFWVKISTLKPTQVEVNEGSIIQASPANYILIREPETRLFTLRFMNNQGNKNSVSNLLRLYADYIKKEKNRLEGN